MSGDRAVFVGDAMAAVVQGIVEIHDVIGEPPVIVGGLAVLARLVTPYRATVDLDVVDRMLGHTPHLEILRSRPGATPVEPSAVLLPTAYGPVRIDVLEVRQVELDHPSDDPGDRLHASAHAWASESATAMRIEVRRRNGDRITTVSRVAEPGPLVAMKLQAIMNRSTPKQGTDLLDVIRLMFDETARGSAISQIGQVNDAMAADIAQHVDLWFVRRRDQMIHAIHRAGGSDVTLDDLELVAELLLAASRRNP